MTFPTKVVLGWAKRGENPPNIRQKQAGKNLENFDPKTQKLPDEFDNQYYNGYDRAISGNVPLPYFGNGEKLTIRSERRLPNPPSPKTFDVTLPGSRPTATLTIKNPQDQTESQDIPLQLDTLIIEPEQNRYLVVWRGIWLYEEARKEQYIELKVQGG
jgi:hypothetical protein